MTVGRDPVHYRRASSLACTWDGDRSFLHQLSTGATIEVAPILLHLLDAFPDWRTADAGRAALPGEPARAVDRAIDALVRVGALEVRARRAVDRGASGLGPWGPAATLFHAATRDQRFAPRATVDRRLRERAKVDPPPSPTKRVAGRYVALPVPAAAGTDGAFLDVLHARRSWRRFGRSPLALDALASLLYHTFGVQRWLHTRGQGTFALKTSPSGGARHSIEAYVVALRVEGLTAGIHHYDPERHALACVKRGAARTLVSEYLPAQGFFGGAAALVLMTSVFARVQWRYRSPRAYRVVLAETGHLGQTFCLVATALGLAPFCTMALADSRIERDLGIDGTSEAVLYAVGVGPRPKGVAWAPYPDTARVPKTTTPRRP